MQPAPIEIHPIPIGIAVVEQNGCYLVGIRDNDGALSGYAEFPGGKCRPDESPEHCALRECREETGLDVLPVELLLIRQFTYPHGTVDLNFWLCKPADAEKVAEEHLRFGWIPAAELAVLQFPEANEPVIAMLIAR
ncbi:MAG: NUDIX domain-containing protein [Planctomycetes bacterium]|nr:NUDIX domain-containing protein [Planctomycetota bacterium]